MQSAITCLSSILRQICSSGDLPQELKELYYNCEKESRRAPRLGDIESVLTSLIQRSKKVYIVIDALDECPEDRDGFQRKPILNWIQKSSEHPSVQIFFTSRNDLGAADIADAVRSHSRSIEVSVDATKTSDDICLYLARQFDSNLKLHKMTQYSNVDITGILREKAGGMYVLEGPRVEYSEYTDFHNRFQWVSCQLDELKSLQVVRLKDIKEILDTLPPTLDGVYTRVLSSIHPRLLTDVANALRWLSFSLQPMTIEEINEACIISLNSITPINDDDRMEPKDLLTLLKGLVITRPLKRRILQEVENTDLGEFLSTGHITYQEEEHVELCLSHFSVKEFLTCRGNQDNHLYQLETYDSHKTIAMNCIAYLFYYSSSPKKYSTKQDLKSFPVLWYACRFWFEHVRLAGESGGLLTPHIIQLLQSLPVWTDCLLVYNPYITDCNPFTRRVKTKFASALGWAAVLGLDLVAECLLAHKTEDINADQDEDQGQSEFHGIGDPVDLWRPKPDGTALVKAIAFGHEKLVRLLIKEGATIDYAALDAACSYEKENILRVLLDAGADPTTLQGENEVILDTAAWSGNAQIVKILLEMGVNPNGSSTSKISPLIRAASLGYFPVCELLVSHQADISTRTEDPEYPDALAAAARMGHIHIVEFLLAQEQQVVDITDDALYSSLTGSEDGPTEDHRTLCRFLVEKGADLDPICKIYDRPLAIALYNGWEDIVKLMIDKGAKTEQDDPSCLCSGNLLQSAVLSRNTELLALLLDRRINIDAPSIKVEPYSYQEIENISAAPLHAAVYYLDIDMTRLLLQRKANVNSPGEPYNSPLGALAAGVMQYVYSPREWLLKAEVAEAIYLLLDKSGADLKSAKALCKDKKSSWALQRMGKKTLQKEVQYYITLQAE